MAFRFRKSIKLAPGVKLNVGKKSVGVSVGGKYGGVSFNSRSGSRARVSAPGTGLSYTTSLNSKSSSKATPSHAPAPVEKEKKPFYKSWLFWAAVIVVLLLLSSCSASPAPENTVVSLSPSPAASTPLPTAEPATPAPSADPEIRDYVLNTNSFKFHYPSCYSVEKIKPSNREAFTGTRQELIQRGYDSCGICHP